MNKLSKYIRENLLGITIGCAVIVFSFEAIVFPTHNFYFTQACGAVVFLVASLERYLSDKAKEKLLKAKGLTLSDVKNIEFVKNWEVQRQRGMYKYCLIDGGIMVGMIILLPVSLLGMLAFNDIRTLFSDFELMLLYIFSCIAVGYFCGATLYLLRWMFNEKRFNNLIDPLR